MQEPEHVGIIAQRVLAALREMAGDGRPEQLGGGQTGQLPPLGRGEMQKGCALPPLALFF
jgi:hypothetical protein